MGDVTEATIVLKAIENSIDAFCLFVKTEEMNPQKTWWRIRSAKWTFQSLEDPKDFNLLCDITNSIQKVTKLMSIQKNDFFMFSYNLKMMHLLICSEEKTMDKRVERHENMVQVKRIKGAQRM